MPLQDSAPFVQPCLGLHTLPWGQTGTSCPATHPCRWQGEHGDGVACRRPAHATIRRHRPLGLRSARRSRRQQDVNIPLRNYVPNSFTWFSRTDGGHQPREEEADRASHFPGEPSQTQQPGGSPARHCVTTQSCRDSALQGKNHCPQPSQLLTVELSRHWALRTTPAPALWQLLLRAPGY